MIGCECSFFASAFKSQPISWLHHFGYIQQHWNRAISLNSGQRSKYPDIYTEPVSDWPVYSYDRNNRNFGKRKYMFLYILSFTKVPVMSVKFSENKVFPTVERFLSSRLKFQKNYNVVKINFVNRLVDCKIRFKYLVMGYQNDNIYLKKPNIIWRMV
jgi:hypothetical protein